MYFKKVVEELLIKSEQNFNRANNCYNVEDMMFYAGMIKACNLLMKEIDPEYQQLVWTK
jgi:hypothetical protein